MVSPSPPSLSGLAIRRHIGTVMLTLAVLVVGFFYASRLPVDLLPSITYPRIGVRLNAPGIAASVAVQQIARPLEEALSTTDGVTQVVSRTREGQVSVDLYFPAGQNVDQALNDVTAAFNRAQGRLPDVIDSPRIFKVDPSQLPVYEFALTASSLSPRQLREFADQELARELGVVPGVATVDVAGGEAEEVSVQLDLPRLQAYGITINQVLSALRDRNQDVSGGRLRGSQQELLTRTLGQFQTVEDIRQLPLNSQGIRLQDVATVALGAAQDQVDVRLNQQPAVKFSIQKQGDANTIAVVDGLKARLDQLRQNGLITPEMQLVITTDEAVFIRNAVSNVVGSAALGSLLAAVAVLLFLGSVRQTLIIVMAIPLTSLAALILMGAAGLSINIFSLGGLALGVGIVVDNAIVMLEQIVGHWRPQSSLEEAIRSSQEIESALVASTATNLVAVLPFLLIGGIFSLLFRELILTVCFAVGASLLMAVTVVPMLTARLIGLPWKSGLQQSSAWQQVDRGLAVFVNRYARFLFGVLHHRIWVLSLTIMVCLSSTVWMWGQLNQEILPRINTGQALLNAQFPPGTGLDINRRVMEQVDQILKAHPQTEFVFSSIGGSLFGSNTTVNPTRSGSTISLKPGTNIDDYIADINRQFEQLHLVGIRLRLRPGQVRGLNFSNSTAQGAELDVTLEGDDPVALQRATQLVLDRLDREVTLAAFRPDGEDRQPEVQILPDWTKLGTLGLSVREIGDLVSTAIQGSLPTDLQQQERLIPVRVQLRRDTLASPDQLRQLPLLLSNGGILQLQDLAQLVPGQAAAEIQRINKKQVVVLAGNLNPRAILGEALAQVDQVMDSLNLPPGVVRAPSDAAASNRELQQTLVQLGSLAVFLVFTVMAVQYNSLVDPLVIILTIPLAITGGVVGLYLTQTPVGATVMVGAVLLVGIVVNNAILMVELANQLRLEEGIDRRTAILQAAPLRLRPILMTTITTVLGLYPLAAGIGLQQGGEFLQPLGIFVFWGLSLATGLTLLIIPCFYVVGHEMVDWCHQRLIPAPRVASPEAVSEEKVRS